jgi:U3 small nucleolar RNA-associated protein 3
MDSSGSANGALPIFDLVEPVYGSPKSTSRKPDNDPTDIDAYGEATSLHHADQADKNARKKSLRFHISKIASASARRQGARNNRVGGDDDIPYRERRKEQVARLANESEKKAEDGSGDDAEEDVDGYYKLIERKTKEKKAKKKADYEEAQAAARYVSHFSSVFSSLTVDEQAGFRGRHRYWSPFTYSGNPD